MAAKIKGDKSQVSACFSSTCVVVVVVGSVMLAPLGRGQEDDRASLAQSGHGPPVNTYRKTSKFSPGPWTLATIPGRV